MLNQEETKNIVISAINDVIEAAGELLASPVTEKTMFVEHLVFSSLMMAQLIMLIQEHIDKEPFLDNIAISDISTVGDMIKAYCYEIDFDKGSVYHA